MTLPLLFRDPASSKQARREEPIRNREEPISAIAMASSDLASFTNPCIPICPTALPAAANHLLNQLSVACEALLGLPFGNHHLLHRHFHHQQQSLRVSRTPQLSALGFASLLLGISSTLMFFGSFAFLLGLMLMPFILPLAIVACIGVLIASFKTPFLDFCSLLPSSSPSSSGDDPVLLAKLGF